MRWLLVASAAALVFGAGGAAMPVPVESRAAAILELAAALKEEREAIALLKRDPPQTERARTRIWRSVDRMYGIQRFLSTIPGADAENLAGGAASDDVAAADLIRNPALERALFFLERAVLNKRALQPLVREAKPPPATAPQCSDGKDNDRDGLVDATTESGCSSERDIREQSPFHCAVGSRIASGRLSLSGSCTGAFAEIEVTLLDDLQLNGRFDIQHAPSCRPPEPTRLRCTAKDGAQNPRHLVSMQIATTSMDPAQRVQLRFFDVRKRLIGRFLTARR